MAAAGIPSACAWPPSLESLLQFEVFVGFLFLFFPSQNQVMVCVTLSDEDKTFVVLGAGEQVEGRPVSTQSPL